MVKLLLNKGIGGFPKSFLKSICKDEEGDFGYGLGLRSDSRVVELV